MTLTLYRNVHESSSVAAEGGGHWRKPDAQGRDARMLRRARLFCRYVTAVFTVHRIRWGRIGWRASTGSPSSTGSSAARWIPNTTAIAATANNVVDDRIVGLTQTRSETRRFQCLWTIKLFRTNSNSKYFFWWASDNNLPDYRVVPFLENFGGRCGKKSAVRLMRYWNADLNRKRLGHYCEVWTVRVSSPIRLPIGNSGWYSNCWSNRRYRWLKSSTRWKMFDGDCHCRSNHTSGRICDFQHWNSDCWCFRTCVNFRKAGPIKHKTKTCFDQNPIINYFISKKRDIIPQFLDQFYLFGCVSIKCRVPVSRSRVMTGHRVRWRSTMIVRTRIAVSAILIIRSFICQSVSTRCRVVSAGCISLEYQWFQWTNPFTCNVFYL